MGQRRDAEIATFQRESGIVPATGERAEKLTRLQALAFELIRIVELERSGIRDGDGFWGGCHPLHDVVDDMVRVDFEMLEAEVRATVATATAPRYADRASKGLA